VVLREFGRPTDACLELARESIRPHFDVLVSIVAELAPRLAPQKRHLVAFSVVGQCLHYRVAAPIIQLLVSEDEYARYEPELLADHITDLTLRGIGAR
jgi:hypothetical protein